MERHLKSNALLILVVLIHYRIIVLVSRFLSPLVRRICFFFIPGSNCFLFQAEYSYFSSDYVLDSSWIVNHSSTFLKKSFSVTNLGIYFSLPYDFKDSIRQIFREVLVAWVSFAFSHFLLQCALTAVQKIRLYKLKMIFTIN